jgi:ATP-dependent DNA helicase RecG
VALRTSERREDRDEPLFQQGTATGKPQIFVGTHALLYENDSISRLGLVVIDEQHKFGVAQRARLIARGGTTPDVLVMTATPIPRTLTLTLYGDLDVSVIDQRPKERGKVTTAVRELTKLKDVVKFIRERLDEGRQCYVVYPLIDESEKLDASAATTGYAEWTAHLAPHEAGLLHGRMDAATKDAVMRRFRSGELKALVSTTVIEVGVDVPNATMMVIHDAARFGLAQLHQLRGRIGRGAHTSWCVLFIAKGDKEAQARLHVLEETGDGFVIAEEDLRRRGPGDVLGSAQSGQAPLRFGELLADTRLVTLARRLAERTLGDDPALTHPNHAILRSMVTDREDTGAAMSSSQ